MIDVRDEQLLYKLAKNLKISYDDILAAYFKETSVCKKCKKLALNGCQYCSEHEKLDDSIQLEYCIDETGTIEWLYDPKTQKCYTYEKSPKCKGVKQF